MDTTDRVVIDFATGRTLRPATSDDLESWHEHGCSAWRDDVTDHLVDLVDEMEHPE